MANIKRISVLLIVLALITSVPCSAFAEQNNQDAAITDKQAEEIERLFRERAELAANYEENEERIAAIDQKIQSLGAENVSDEYVASKQQKSNALKSKGFKAPIPTYSGVQWTSYRQKTNVNGIVYELQIITGVPNTPDSDLLAHSLTYPKTPDAKYSAICSLVFSIIAPGAEAIPGASLIISVADIAKNAYAVITSGKPETVYGVNCSAVTAVTSTIRFVYVKYDGSPDSGQICMYLGNSSQCETTFTVGYNKMNSDGSYTATNEICTKQYVIQSSGYSDYNTMCFDYYKYKTYGTSFESCHYVYSSTLDYKVEENGSYTSIKNGAVKLPVIS